MATHQIEENNIQQSSYLIPATTTTTTPTPTVQTNENQILCDIKLICSPRKKTSKRCTYLTFIESCPTDQPCIEITGKHQSNSIPFDDCISFEYFDTIKNDFQSSIYIFFESNTIAILFSTEHIEQKSIIIKHLDNMYQKKLSNQTNDNQLSPILSQNIGQFNLTEQILHTFDVKIIPYGNIITRDHVLIGPARIYFTTTDLYIASFQCKHEHLKQTITNQCPTKDKQILCIPYFTIKHYGNRSNIFLIELGKSNYGNGEIHMSCSSSSLASTIHLLVSPVIEERPLVLSSAFRNQLLTNKRMEKSKHIHPPVQLTQETIEQKRMSIDSLTKRSHFVKSRSFIGFFRKFLTRSQTFDQPTSFDEQSIPTNTNKFFEFNIEENHFSHKHSPSTELPQQTIDQPLSNNEAYLDMGLTCNIPLIDENIESKHNHDDIQQQSTATVDIAVNTIISIPPHIHSAMIVGNNVHIIAEERTVFPIGQRSFTSPASVMQPFKTQLTSQTNPNSTGTRPINPHNSSTSFLLTYALVTFDDDNNQHSTNDISDNSITNSRLNSDLSLLSLTRQQQPSSILSFNSLLSSSSSSSHIFRTLSFSTNTNNTNNSNGNLFSSDENHSDQTTNYLLGPLPPAHPSTSTIVDQIHLNNEHIETISSNDCYAPLNSNLIERKSPSNIRKKPSRISEETVAYTDVICPININYEQQSDENQCDPFEDKTDRSSTLLYTDIDFHQMQRRDRIGQLSAISKKDEQIPPFRL